MKFIGFKVADNDLKVIKDNAKSDNKTLSNYVRDRVLSKAKAEAESRDKEANVFIKEVQEIKTNGKILFTKLSEIDGKIASTNDRITALENRNTAFEERLLKGINETLIGYLKESFIKLRDHIKINKGGN